MSFAFVRLQNGLFYYLGSNGRSSAWINPMQLGKVTVTASQWDNDSDVGPIHHVVGRELNARLMTESQQPRDCPWHWIQIDLNGREFAPTHYSYRYASHRIASHRTPAT